MTLLEFLKQNNISQYRLAKDIGVSKQAINNIVKGKINPSYCLIIKIKERLNISYDELFELLERN